LAQDKKVYPDGAIIFQEGDSGENIYELVSGAVDLLFKRNEKYASKRSILPGNTFGGKDDTTSGIRLFTARANGRTVIRNIKVKNVPAVIANKTSINASPSILNRLLQKISRTPPATPKAAASKPPYSNPGLIRRLMDSTATDQERIGIRVAQLSGLDGDKHSRHIITAIGNTQELETRGVEKVLSINPVYDTSKQLIRLAGAARQYLANQGADLLIWGHVPDSGAILHLHFVTHTNWDQQTPGAFVLETTLALPIDFDETMADFLYAVCLAAVLPQTPNKRQMRASALPSAVDAASAVFNTIPNVFADHEKSCLHLCYGNAIAATSPPQYDTALLSQAKTQYQLALGDLDPNTALTDWAQIKKHIATIIHISALQSQDPEMFVEAKKELTEALLIHNRDNHGQAWAILQHRLGLVLYHLGFNDGDTDQLRMAIRCFHLALLVYTRDDSPARWAEIMSNFARAAKVLGGLQESTDALETAVNAYENVLEYRDRDIAPKAWAASQNNLGSALFLLGKQTRNIEHLNASLAAFKSALAVYQQLKTVKMAMTTQKNLDRANAVILKYQPRNTTQSDWEDALAEGLETSQKKIPLYDIIDDDEEKLPYPGEALQSKSA
jgi:CRP-like cAMP-binding protein/tetratricopeptide (TPR) repeat protein